MNRFDHDFEDEDEDDEDSIDGGNSQPISHNEYKDLIEGDQAIQQETLELSYLELDQKLMGKAIKICERSMFWNFYSIQTRLSMISKAYIKLKKIIDA